MDKNISHHRRKGQRAVRLELEGRFGAAEGVWLDIARAAPCLRWKRFAEHRARKCRNRQRIVHN